MFLVAVTCVVQVVPHTQHGPEVLIWREPETNRKFPQMRNVVQTWHWGPMMSDQGEFTRTPPANGSNTDDAHTTDDKEGTDVCSNLEKPFTSPRLHRSDRGPIGEVLYNVRSNLSRFRLRLLRWTSEHALRSRRMHSFDGDGNRRPPSRGTRSTNQHERKVVRHNNDRVATSALVTATAPT
jgi:hypothetical protein